MLGGIFFYPFYKDWSLNNLDIKQSVGIVLFSIFAPMQKLYKYPVLGFLILGLSACGGLKQTNRPKDSTSSKPSFEHELLNEDPSAPEAGASEKEERPSEENKALQGDLEAFIDDWYGTPHRMGGMTKSGVDCSGFVIIAYQEVFQREFRGRRAEDIFSEMKALDQDELEFGDLVFFKVRGRRIDHVGIYIGDGQFAHTSSSRGVMISKLSNSYWSKRFFKGGRYRA